MLAWASLIFVIFLGILAGRRYGRLVSFAVMVELIQVVILGFALRNTINANLGFRLSLLAALIPGVGFLPGRFGGISLGGLILWLILIVVFALVAMFSRHEPIL